VKGGCRPAWQAGRRGSETVTEDELAETGCRVGSVLTGGNLETALAARLLAGETTAPF